MHPDMNAVIDRLIELSRDGYGPLMSDYNHSRSPELPSASSVLAMSGFATWADLLLWLGLRPVPPIDIARNHPVLSWNSELAARRGWIKATTQLSSSKGKR